MTYFHLLIHVEIQRVIPLPIVSEILLPQKILLRHMDLFLVSFILIRLHIQTIRVVAVNILDLNLRLIMLPPPIFNLLQEVLPQIHFDLIIKVCLVMILKVFDHSEDIVRVAIYV